MRKTLTIVIINFRIIKWEAVRLWFSQQDRKIFQLSEMFYYAHMFGYSWVQLWKYDIF